MVELDEPLSLLEELFDRDDPPAKQDKPNCFLLSLRLQNFKRFHDLVFKFSSSPKVIAGRNGFGKTQLLWAIMVYLRAYNARVEKNSTWHSNGERYLPLTSLFGDPYFEQQDGTVYKSLITSARDTATLTGTFGPKSWPTEIQVQLRATSTEVRHDDGQVHQKIRFAFVQPFYQWGLYSKEVQGSSKHLLTTGEQHLRTRLKDLKSKYKLRTGADVAEILQERLSAVFGIRYAVRIASIVVYVQEELPDGTMGAELEIGACSSSLQKVMALYVLFFLLAFSTAADAAPSGEIPSPASSPDVSEESKGLPDPAAWKSPSTQRILLVDELEALLYETAAARLFDMLASDCEAHGVQLVITSNSNGVVQKVHQSDLLLLGPNGPMSNGGTFYNELCQITSTVRPILVVDGETDVKFIRQFAPRLVEKFTIVPSGSAGTDGSWNHRIAFARALHLAGFKPPIFLKDSEMMASSSRLDNLQRAYLADFAGAAAGVYFTRLPCIESYLYLHLLLASPANAEKVLKEKLSPMLALEESRDYFVEIYKQHSSKLRPSLSNESVQEYATRLWNDRLQALRNAKDHDFGFWRGLVCLLKGHALYKTSRMKQVKSLDPRVQALLDETVDEVLKCAMA
ncbi:hypothetical protein CAOG_01786 [Capsaspora owczarzaki ATCC 30864]|uniref:Rad50/SbcC-type AAA domain-containing protein n=1 Tax=Capsaspora owczarzaki (strain ATCC 30864) TaxID=595528 RepID=A0A0D2U5R3_CAPO3|nr:hypothetical protein CAOG_01786 [Capsaspora owczarzaki ATCC 30864]KJE90476.1 hypothetical protein CAOG_001786 [Capsaspora owczarzaki ATCC 30864]|eukprot:XP_004364654.1 hypothetical protein CAOG_01786 [Capsaspora owczarzaki ATCC 30864]